MTKNEIKAKLTLAINLAENCKMLLDEVCDKLAPSAEDDIFDICNGIQDCEMTDIDQIMEEIEDAGYFKELNISEGEPVEQVSINIDSLLHITTKVPVNGGGCLEAYTSISDYGPQVGVTYASNDDNMIDVVMVEQKQSKYDDDGNIIDNSGEDFNIYIWDNPYTEDYQTKTGIKMTDIKQAFEE